MLSFWVFVLLLLLLFVVSGGGGLPRLTDVQTCRPADRQADKFMSDICSLTDGLSNNVYPPVGGYAVSLLVC